MRQVQEERRCPDAGLAQMALQALIVMLLLMLVALWSGVPPHPPADKAPMVAAITALAWLAHQLVGIGHPRAWWVLALTVLAALPAFAPHKLFTEVHAVALTPVIALGTALLLVLARCAWRLRPGTREAARVASPVAGDAR